MTRRLSIMALAIAAAGLVLAGGTAQALEFPCRTAKLIVPWSPGGGTDVIFRILVEAANKAGAEPQLQVVNISGQSGNKGAKEARRADADGCTLFAMHQSQISTYLAGKVDFTWDAFTPVALLTRTPAIVGANADVAYDDVNGLIAAANERPAEILAGGTPGSTSQFIMLLLEDAAGVKFKHVPYEGTRERMTALLAKNIDIGEINLAATKKYIQTGELKALGITTEERNPEIPSVKTLVEQGIDLVYGTDRGVVLPKGASAEVIRHYEQAFARATKDPSVARQLETKGTSVKYLGHDDYLAYLEGTFSKWKELAIKIGMFKQ